MRLALNEIVWEATGECRNRCDYCGSREGWNTPVKSDTVRAIVDAIGEYPPKEIDISGGDPLLVDLLDHEYILDELKPKGVNCKILANPKGIKTQRHFKILAMYDHVGISVNTREELDLYKEKLPKLVKHTVITNFNIRNSYLAETIAADIPSDTPWQIQFTMYHEAVLNHPDALYSHPEALERLNKDLGKLRRPPLILVADNANSGQCGAGINSMGITAAGDVMGCLSMRSWCEFPEYQGNILDTPLKEIWETRFATHRFGEPKDCKSVCGGKLIDPYSTSFDQENLPDWSKFPTEIVEKAVLAYAVQAPPITVVYAVHTLEQSLCGYSITTSNEIPPASFEVTMRGKQDENAD